jgi:hypothetical protein
MDAKFLNLLTRPNAKITVPGEPPIVLGRGAAALIRMLKSLHDVTPEGHSKANTGKARSQATSTKRDGNTALNGLVTERDFASLSEAEQERLLGK